MSRPSPDRLPLRLGTARWRECGRERTVLVAPLPSAPHLVVDLHRVEIARLARLGEGAPEALAAALVPPRLLPLLEAGPRGFRRARLALAYAEKWLLRGDLPEVLARPMAEVCLLPCLPDPVLLCRADGSRLESPTVGGSGTVLGRLPQPTLAAVGWSTGGPAGFCLAVEDVRGVVLGAWLDADFELRGTLEIRMGDRRRTAPMEVWEGLELPRLRPAEVRLLPPPRFRSLPELGPGMAFSLKTRFETLELTLGDDLVHPTVQ